MLPIRYFTLITAAIAVTIASFAMPRAANAGGGCHEDATSDARATTVSLRRNCFAATVTRVDEGATVTFINEDEVAHNVTGAGYTWGGQPTLYQGDAMRQTFDANGVYVYSCLLHPGMVGAIVVGDGSGPANATVIGGDEALTVSSTGAGANAPADEPAAAAATADDDGATSTTLVLALAGGAAALIALAGGSTLLARARATRKTAAN
jgi:plastocyanin